MNKKQIAIRVSDPIHALTTSLVIAGLKKKHPDHEVGLLATDSCREISTLIPQLDFFFSQSDPQYQDESRFEKIFDLEACDHSLDDELPHWKAYINALSNSKWGNPFHRIDLSRKLADVDLVDANFELLTVENPETPAYEAISSGDGTLKIALCASTLTSEKLLAIANELFSLAFPCTIYITGTIKDKRNSSLFPSEIPEGKQVVDLCGRLSTRGLAHVLRHSDLSISGPGQNAMLSSGYGTLSFCFDEKAEEGPLYYPYGHGHLVFQPQFSSSSTVPSLMRVCIEFAVITQKGVVPSLEQWQEFFDSLLNDYLGKIRVFGSQRIEVLLQDQSLTELYLRPFIFLGHEFYDVAQAFYRLLLEYSLNSRLLVNNDLDTIHEDTVARFHALLKPLEQLCELANFGGVYCSHIHDSLQKGNLERAQLESQRLSEVENLIYSIGINHPALSLLCNQHNKIQNLLANDDPKQLSQEMSKLFQRLKEQGMVFLDLEKSLFHTTLQREAVSSNIAREEGMIHG